MSEHASTTTTPQNDAAPPQPRTEHREMQAFVGEWKTEGHLRTDDGGIGQPITSVDIYEWLPGGFFVTHRWDSQVGDAVAAGLEIIGYDDDRRAYRADFFDNQGGSGSEQLTRQGATWTWLGTNVMGVKHHRCVATLTDDGRTFVARHERSDDGAHWTPWMDVTLNKVK